LMQERQAAGGGDKVAVTVVLVPTSRLEKFTVPKSDTLQQVLDLAYSAFGEKPQQGDTYFCKSGENLTSEVSKTIESVISRNCREAVIEIRRSTGGA